MTRTLLMIVAIGALTSVACFSVSNALGGPDWDGPDWSGPWDWHRRGPAISADGPEVSRTMAWQAGEALTINVGAEVEYTQGPTASMVVTGPKGAVDNLMLHDGRLSYDRNMRGQPRLKVVATAPAVDEFTLNGSQTLRIAGFDRPELEVAIHGSGDVVAKGRADKLELRIAGSGDADLGGLATGSAEINIAGSGEAIVAPRDRAEVNIAGSGDVTFTVRPAQLESHVAGSGKIRQPEPAAPAS